jgi:hypothetical protein
MKNFGTQKAGHLGWDWPLMEYGMYFMAAILTGGIVCLLVI